VQFIEQGNEENTQLRILREEEIMKNMLPERNENMERALEKAAKMICTLQYGRCPVQEEHFPGCPCVCHEDILPWQCWVSYLLATVAGTAYSR
jgi:hypothetical protein